MAKHEKEKRAFEIGARVYASTCPIGDLGTLLAPAKYVRGTVTFTKRWRDGELHVSVIYDDGISATVNSRNLGLGEPRK